MAAILRLAEQGFTAENAELRRGSGTYPLAVI